MSREDALRGATCRGTARRATLFPVRPGGHRRAPRGIRWRATPCPDLHALRRRAAGLTTLVEVSGALASTLDLAKVLQATTDGMCRLSAFDTAAVYLLEGETLRLGATTPPLPPEFPDRLRLAQLADHPHVARALADGSPVFIPDARTAALTEAERIAAEQRGLRTIVYVPMIAGVKPVGALIVSDTDEPRVLGADEVDLCRTLANLAALATENARLFQASREDAAALARRSDEARRADAERLERRLLHAQKLESLGLLAGGVAHDFNNLLQAELAGLELAPGSPAREAIEQAAHAARRATDLARQLLAYSGGGRSSSGPSTSPRWSGRTRTSSGRASPTPARSSSGSRTTCRRWRRTSVSCSRW